MPPLDDPLRRWLDDGSPIVDARPAEPQSNMIDGMAAPKPAPPPGPAPDWYTLLHSMPDTSGPGPHALQEPASWDYDFNPATGSSRATYRGEVVGTFASFVTSFNTRTGAVVLTQADVVGVGALISALQNVNIQSFIVAGAATYTPHAQMLCAIAIGIGGGGGSGGCAGGSAGFGAAAGGGGGGEPCVVFFARAAALPNLAVNVGAAGTAGAAGNNNGGNGGNTTLGAILTANGGALGLGSATATGADGGEGGTGGTGTIVGKGEPGGPGIPLAVSVGPPTGGAGGSSLFGAGGRTRRGSAAGLPGVLGGGASGASSSDGSAAQAGAIGGVGGLFVIEFLGP